MELKWVEDLVVLVRSGHFARAAELRSITQSALSRRIQSLEQWVGAQLVDRSRHPIALTPAGREFLGPAQEIVKQAYDAQAAASNSLYASNSEVRINTLHSLSVRLVPKLIAEMQASLGYFDVSVDSSARSLEDDMQSLRNELCDFFICVRNPAYEFGIDPNKFMSISIAHDRMRPYARDKTLFERFSPDSDEIVPLLSLYRSSTSARTMQSMLAATPFQSRLKTVYRASLTESLKQAALLGMGIAWLPDSLACDGTEGGQLHAYKGGYEVNLEIKVIRASNNNRPIVERIWDYLVEQSLTKA